jgi:hypothetical protein
MPDKYGFDHLPNWDVITMSCIEIGCNASGPSWIWTEEKRKEHSLSHSSALEKMVTVIDGDSLRMRKDNCRVCSAPFDQVRKRGRPRVLCYVCKPE